MIHNLNCCCVWQKEKDPESSIGIPESRTTTAAGLSPPALDKGKLPDKLKNDGFYHMQVQSMDRMDQLDKERLLAQETEPPAKEPQTLTTDSIRGLQIFNVLSML